jgi:hypothetical protein
MDTPTSSEDTLSSQTIVGRTAQPPPGRTILVRINLRILAAVGAGLLVFSAFLPWVDPAAQRLLGSERLAPIVQGWPSLLIGLIALGVLALPHSDSARWVSLPTAALGLAAAVIAVASAITASNAIAAATARFPTSDAGPTTVVGAGVILTIVGGIVCVIAGLTQPASAAEARFDLRTNQPAFSVLATAFVLVALISGAIGWWLASNQTGQPDAGPAGLPTDIFSTPVIDAQVTPLGTAPEPAATVEVFPTDSPSPLVTPIATEFAPTATPTPGRPPLDTATPTPSSTPTSTPTATFETSPLDS